MSNLVTISDAAVAAGALQVGQDVVAFLSRSRSPVLGKVCEIDAPKEVVVVQDDGGTSHRCSIWRVRKAACASEGDASLMAMGNDCWICGCPTIHQVWPL